MQAKFLKAMVLVWISVGYLFARCLFMFALLCGVLGTSSLAARPGRASPFTRST